MSRILVRYCREELPRGIGELGQPESSPVLTGRIRKKEIRFSMVFYNLESGSSKLLFCFATALSLLFVAAGAFFAAGVSISTGMIRVGFYYKDPLVYARDCPTPSTEPSETRRSGWPTHHRRRYGAPVARNRTHLHSPTHRISHLHVPHFPRTLRVLYAMTCKVDYGSFCKFG